MDASAAIEWQPFYAMRLSRISLKTIFTFSESPGAASDGMLRALGFGCCASAPFFLFFLDAALRAAFWHVGTRPFLPSIATTPRREAALCVQGRFDLSFSRGSYPALVADLNVECFMA